MYPWMQLMQSWNQLHVNKACCFPLNKGINVHFLCCFYVMLLDIHMDRCTNPCQKSFMKLFNLLQAFLWVYLLSPSWYEIGCMYLSLQVCHCCCPSSWVCPDVPWPSIHTSANRPYGYSNCYCDDICINSSLAAINYWQVTITIIMWCETNGK